MKLYAPKYYSDFACIKGACRHSCCRGWEIDIDPRTREKYSHLSHSYREKIEESIMCENDGTAHFRLLENENCPHLDECGLCKIITEVGEDYLCDICREHPRFYNLTKRGKEVGLGMACEEACKIILSSDAFGEFVEIGETCEDCEAQKFDTAPYIEKIYSLLSDTALPYPEVLMHIYADFGVNPASISDDGAREMLSSLEYLDGESERRFFAYSSEVAQESYLDLYLRRALAYFVFRHVSPAEDECDLRASLALALFLERLLFSVAIAEGLRDTDSLVLLARKISEEIEYSEDNCDLIKAEFIFA